MAKARGYEGSVQQLRKVLRRLRPLPVTAYLALTKLPGEEAQADWGSFGTIRVGRAEARTSTSRRRRSSASTASFGLTGRRTRRPGEGVEVARRRAAGRRADGEAVEGRAREAQGP